MSDLPAGEQHRSATRTQIALLEAVCQELSHQGRPARLIHWWLHDELDVRLMVAGCPDRPDVEVLGPYEPATPAARWCAVVVHATSRVVWAGPARSCTRMELFRFIDDLQHAAAPERSGRYTMLG